MIDQQAALSVMGNHEFNAAAYHTPDPDIPEDPIDVDHLVEYSSEELPIFIGHYWMDTDPALLAPNVACLDYSVAASSGGKLVAYRWDGEQRLSQEKFVHVVRETCQAQS